MEIIEVVEVEFFIFQQIKSNNGFVAGTSLDNAQ